jgi:phosphoribosyl 1,2-cyclic phosphodiesterase
MNLTPGPKDGCIRGEHSFTVGDITVRAVTVPHDAREPVQYCFHAGGQQLGVLTDLGHCSAHVVEAYEGCDGLLLEFNHEPELLAEGPYPPTLKRRVGGPFGHLANAQAEGLLSALTPERLQFLVAGHLSAQNNRTELVAEALDRTLRSERTTMHIAEQDGFSGWFSLG